MLHFTFAVGHLVTDLGAGNCSYTGEWGTINKGPG